MKRKIFLAKISMVFAVFVLCLSTFAFLSLNRGTAWFSSNKKVDTDGLSVSLTDERNIIESVTYYEVKDITLVEGKNEYLFSATEGNAQPAMPSFSPIDAKRQVMLKITLKSEMAVEVSAKTNARKAYPTTFKNTDNDLSSVIKFYAPTTVTTTENGYTLSGANLGEEKRFAEFTRDDSGAIISKNFAADGQVELYNGTTKDIYVVFDYYEDSMDVALEYANTNNLGVAESSLDPPMIKFACDFSIVIAPTGGAE